jgi:hypothetical protein
VDDRQVTASELLTYDAERFEITHESGIGSRRVFVPVTSGWRNVLVVLVFVLFLGGALGLFALVMNFIERSRRRRHQGGSA